MIRRDSPHRMHTTYNTHHRKPRAYTVYLLPCTIVCVLNFCEMAIGKMSGESVKATGEDLVWNTELEVSLFYAMRGHKPVGVNKNFQMMCIHEKFNQATGRQVTSKQIWDHLETLYDMQALHESEILPFPNKEVDFSLPTTDFQDMMQQRSKKSGESFKALSTSSHDSSKSDTPKSLLKLGTPSGVLAGTPSEKDNSPKRKRTRQAGSTPTETPSTKRRR